MDFYGIRVHDGTSYFSVSFFSLVFFSI
uniref:Uncharacterized protein n=1 Tax=Arundo donax TaxID=35708 RepID=A0A0A8YLM9_ARUDO